MAEAGSSFVLMHLALESIQCVDLLLLILNCVICCLLKIDINLYILQDACFYVRNCSFIHITLLEIKLLLLTFSCLLSSFSLNSDILGFNSMILIQKLLPAIHLRKYVLKKEKWFSLLTIIRRKKYVDVLLTVGFAKSS